MKILILDNYDSFTYNLYHYVQPFCAQVTVARNDELTLEATDAFTHIILSPGPGLPKDSGILMDVIARHAGKKPLLGICLGMQAIAEHFGGKLYNLPEVKHGVTTAIAYQTDEPFFAGIRPPTTVGLYHSWAVEAETLPQVLAVAATSAEGVIMALRHKNLPIFGVQFHPESILTPQGKTMLNNWLHGGKPAQANNPLHGVTFASILAFLEQHYGWEELGNRINIRCFKVSPSIKSSLAFLRKTPWARSKVEELYVKTLSQNSRNKSH